MICSNAIYRFVKYQQLVHAGLPSSDPVKGLALPLGRVRWLPHLSQLIFDVMKGQQLLTLSWNYCIFPPGKRHLRDFLPQVVSLGSYTLLLGCTHGACCFCSLSGKKVLELVPVPLKNRNCLVGFFYLSACLTISRLWRCRAGFFNLHFALASPGSMQ